MRSACQWMALVLVLAGCGGAPGREAGRSAGGAAGGDAARPSGIGRTPRAAAHGAAAAGRLSAAEARAFLASHPEALVLDVRNPDEWDDDLGHIEGARQIPLPELAARVDEIAGWKAKPIVAVCRVGGRSRRAAELLRASGFRHVMNLEGGMVAWRQGVAARGP